MHIPFVDLKAQYCAHRTEIDAAIAAVIDGTEFIRGKFVPTLRNLTRRSTA